MATTGVRRAVADVKSVGLHRGCGVKNRHDCEIIQQCGATKHTHLVAALNKDVGGPGLPVFNAFRLNLRLLRGLGLVDSMEVHWRSTKCTTKTTKMAIGLKFLSCACVMMMMHMQPLSCHPQALEGGVNAFALSDLSGRGINKTKALSVPLRRQLLALTSSPYSITGVA